MSLSKAPTAWRFHRKDIEAIFQSLSRRCLVNNSSLRISLFKLIVSFEIIFSCWPLHADCIADVLWLNWPTSCYQSGKFDNLSRWTDLNSLRLSLPKTILILEREEYPMNLVFKLLLWIWEISLRFQELVLQSASVNANLLSARPPFAVSLLGSY